MATKNDTASPAAEHLEKHVQKLFNLNLHLSNMVRIAEGHCDQTAMESILDAMGRYVNDSYYIIKYLGGDDEDADALSAAMGKTEASFDGGLKAEQLAVLTRLVSDKTAGFALELSQEDVMYLSSLAADLSREVVASVSPAPSANAKRGA